MRQFPTFNIGAQIGVRLLAGLAISAVAACGTYHQSPGGESMYEPAQTVLQRFKTLCSTPELGVVCEEKFLVGYVDGVIILNSYSNFNFFDFVRARFEDEDEMMQAHRLLSDIQIGRLEEYRNRRLVGICSGFFEVSDYPPGVQFLVKHCSFYPE